MAEQVTTWTLRKFAQRVSFDAGDVVRDLRTVENPDPDIASVVGAINAVMQELNRYSMLQTQRRLYGFVTVDDVERTNLIVTQGSAAFSVDSIPQLFDAYENRAFAMDAENAVYRIVSIDPGVLSGVLDAPWAGDSVASPGGTGRIAQNLYAAPSNLKELKSAYLHGSFARRLEVVTSREVWDERFGANLTLMNRNAPKAITIHPDRDPTTGAWQFELDAFADDVYRIDTIIDTTIDTLAHDEDVMPIEDQHIELAIEGAVAKWRSVSNADPTPWLTWTRTRLVDFTSSVRVKTDTATRLVPQSTRSPVWVPRGREDWKDL